MINMFRTYLRALVKSEKGATAVEYGIMVTLIAVAIIAAVTLVGGALTDQFGVVSDALGGG